VAGRQAAELMLKLEQHIADQAVELVLEITANVREATPIDTGHAAASWVESVGAPVGEQLGIAGISAGELLGFKLGDGDLFVSNPTDYIQLLNDPGISPQAEAHFIERGAEQALQTVQERHNERKVPL
jgi:hypothetical protein